MNLNLKFGEAKKNELVDMEVYQRLNWRLIYLLCLDITYVESVINQYKHNLKK